MPFDPSCIEVEDYLDCLDFRNVQKATEKEIRFSCPMPAHDTGDENPSAYMNIETTAWFCHSCHAKGNAITLAAKVLGVSPLEATRMLRQRYSPGGIDPSSRSMVEEIQKMREGRQHQEKRQNRVLPESCLERYSISWHRAYVNELAAALYLVDRGFTIETLIDWQFGWSRNHNRVTLPIRDEIGQLVGIKARALDDRKPKYLNLRDEENDIEPYLKNNVVFGLYRAVGQHLIVVEGEYNAVMMRQLGYRNVVAINGSYFGERQVKLLIRHAERVTLFFDSDTAGRDATEAVCEALRPFMPVFVVPDHDGDPCDMHSYSVARCVREARSARELLLARS